MKEFLSIAIPTYNRRDQLHNQLSSILMQNTAFVKEIIIIDNDSSYDIASLVNSFENKKIKLYRNPINVKMPVNLANVFMYSSGDWLWTLSDDDQTLPNSIETIYQTINECASDVGFIKFAKSGSPTAQKTTTVKKLEEFIDYYYNETHLRSGDLVFLSTNLYNIKVIGKEYLSYAFEFAYTYIPQLIPVFFLLNEKSITAHFSSNEIVKYLPPRGDKYNISKVGKGFSTISHLPLTLSKKYWKRFLKISMSVTYIGQISSCLKANNKSAIKDFKIIYNNIYRYYLPIHTKLLINAFLIIGSSNLGLIFLINMKELAKKFK